MRGQELRDFREDVLRASRPQLAQLVGVSEITLVRWETADTSSSGPHGLQLVVLDALLALAQSQGAGPAREIIALARTDLRRALTVLFERSAGLTAHHSRRAQ